MAWMGVDLSALVVTLEAWFCTLVAFFSKLDFGAVPQVKIPYSRTSLMCPFLCCNQHPPCPREFLHKCHMKFCLCGALFSLTLPGHSSIKRDFFLFLFLTT